MSNKFKNVPMDQDTKLLINQEADLGEYSILYQMWTWEGYKGESFIFDLKDVSEMNDEELEKIVRSSPIVQPSSSVTIKRSESGFAFVNFNFESLSYDDDEDW